VGGEKDVVVLEKGAVGHPVFNGKGPAPGLHGMPAETFDDLAIIIAMDEVIGGGLVDRDAEFAGDVAFHPATVAIKMIGRDVEQDGDVRPEFHDPVQLETAQFKYIES